MANWLLPIVGIAFIACFFVAMGCLGVMGVVAKGLFLPWETNRVVELYRRRFPNSLIYKLFSVSAIGSAVFAGIGLVALLWIVIRTK